MLSGLWGLAVGLLGLKKDLANLNIDEIGVLLEISSNSSNLKPPKYQIAFMSLYKQPFYYFA